MFAIKPCYWLRVLYLDGEAVEVRWIKVREGIKRGKALPEGKAFLKCLFERSERN